MRHQGLGYERSVVAVWPEGPHLSKRPRLEPVFSKLSDMRSAHPSPTSPQCRPQCKIGQPTVQNRAHNKAHNRAQNREIGKIGKILLCFVLLLSKWADNRSIGWIKSNISSWSFYVFIIVFQTNHFCQNRRFGDLGILGKKVQKGPAASKQIFLANQGGGKSKNVGEI